jgi:hypothetical protein
MLGTFREPESCFEVAVREFTMHYVKTVREGVGGDRARKRKGLFPKIMICFSAGLQQFETIGGGNETVVIVVGVGR